MRPMTEDPINPQVRTKAKNLGSQFQSARPFRHVVIDSFLKAEVADALLSPVPFRLRSKQTAE